MSAGCWAVWHARDAMQALTEPEANIHRLQVAQFKPWLEKSPKPLAAACKQRNTLQILIGTGGSILALEELRIPHLFPNVTATTTMAKILPGCSIPALWEDRHVGGQ